MAAVKTERWCVG